MTTSSTSFVPLFAIEKTIRRSRAEQAAALFATVIRFTIEIPGRVRRLVRIWNMRLNDRAYLAGLQEFQLSEMGLTRDQRDQEIRKPFWDE